MDSIAPFSKPNQVRNESGPVRPVFSAPAKWSLIPLIDNAKQPAIHWQEFQRRHPTADELATWMESYTNFGVVCGQISNLAVLDIDDSSLLPELQRRRLTSTYTVQTRRGYHFYYLLPPELADLRTDHRAGADLQANGAYVVSSGSTVGGFTYFVCHDAPRLTLTADRLQVILQIIGADAPITDIVGTFLPISQPREELTGQRPDLGCIATPNPPADLHPKADPADILATYQAISAAKGRNIGLYSAGVLASAAGLTAQGYMEIIAPVFIPARAPAGHAPQTEQQRATEMALTIASAFKPGRPLRPGRTIEADRRQLPTGARERLMQTGRIGTARTLDGLYLTGHVPGSWLTERQIVEALQPHGVGRDVIRAALTDPRIFRTAPIGTRARPDSANTSNANTGKGQKPRAIPFGYGVQNANKLIRGPIPRLYRMPTPAQVCKALHVRLTRTDPIHLQDIASATRYRQAIHTALIHRAPGIQLSRRYLAARLGCKSKRTVDRYNRDAGVIAVPQYERQPVHWHTLDRLPVMREDAAPGAHLEAGGKKYPPIRCIAARLLKAEMAPELVTRLPNRYWLRADAPPDVLKEARS